LDKGRLGSLVVVWNVAITSVSVLANRAWWAAHAGSARIRRVPAVIASMATCLPIFAETGARWLVGLSPLLPGMTSAGSARLAACPQPPLPVLPPALGHSH